MGNAITQDTRAIWLMLQRDGGWWTVAMLTHHWRPTFQPYEVQQAVDALEAGGFLDSRNQGGEDEQDEQDEKASKRIYAFTSDCMLLPDLAIAGQPGALA